MPENLRAEFTCHGASAGASTDVSSSREDPVTQRGHCGAGVRTARQEAGSGLNRCGAKHESG